MVTGLRENTGMRKAGPNHERLLSHALESGG